MRATFQTELRDWASTYVLEPYLEGAERIRRFVEGRDFHKLDYPTLSRPDRIISLLSGLCLMLPFINIVIWLAMKIFGNPERLSDPHRAAFKKLPEKKPLLAQTAPPDNNEKPLEVENIRHFETKKKDGTSIEANWVFQRYRTKTVVTKIDPRDRVITHLDADGNMYRYDFTRSSPKKRVMVIERTPDKITVSITRSGKASITRETALDPEKPWIQQPTTGFRPFVRSTKTDLPFYSVDPRNGAIWDMKATKKGLVPLPGHGNVVKIEVSCQNWGFGWLPKSNFWFDPTTGHLLRMEYSEPNDDFLESDSLLTVPTLEPMVLTKEPIAKLFGA